MTPNHVTVSEETADRLADLVRSVPPGQRITLNNLRIALRRGAVGRPSPELEEALADPARLRDTVLADDRLRCLAFAMPDGLGRRRWTGEERRRAILDVNNLVWTLRHRDAGAPARLAPVEKVVLRLRSLGCREIVAVADANLSHLVRDDPALLKSWCDRVEVAPGGTPADVILLEIARDAGGLVVSNDRFRDWRRASQWHRRSLWRLRMPVKAAAGAASFHFGEAEAELRDSPPQDCPGA